MRYIITQVSIHPNRRPLTKIDSIRRSSEDEKLKTVNKVAEMLSGKRNTPEESAKNMLFQCSYYANC